MMERSLTWRKSRLVRYAMTVVMLTVLLTVFGVRDGVMAAELPYDTIEDATGISIAEFETIVKNEIKIQNEGESTFVSEVDERHTKIKNYDLQNAYVEYVLSNRIITEYEKEKQFQNLITDQYIVKVPCEMEDGSPAFIEFGPENGTLSFYSLSISAEKPSDMTAYNELEQIVSDAKLDGPVEQIRFTYCNLYHMQLVYIKTSDSEYVMPGMTWEYKGITQKKIYEVNAFFDKMNYIFDESAINPDANGGVPYRKHFVDLIPLGILIVGVLGVMVCTALLIKKRHQFHQKVQQA